MSTTVQYNAAIYVRLSKEDIDAEASRKAESDSITNQKQLILDYLQDKPDINIVSVRVDDGYTGTNFDRPDFQRMMDDIEAGRVNCVVVKDLSRFGREYINAGKYIDRLFPYYGVRLIAINDNIDTITRSASDDFSITVKNLMNDNYCRDLSIKIRSQFQVKRRNGEYTGAFAPYGYRKAADDHNKLEVDPYPAGVIQDIFRWRLEGLSMDSIAKRLTERKILSPIEYKRSQGSNIKTCFQKYEHTTWSPVYVRRILSNPIYAGTLVQGIRTKPNYKINRIVTNSPEDWIVVENAVEPIINVRTFQLVQRLMLLDTRTAPNSETVHPLAGLLVCGDCGGPMIRKCTTDRGKKYAYYICHNNKKYKNCSSHSFSEKQLTETVLFLLQQHIALIAQMDECIKAIKGAPLQKISVKKAQDRMASCEVEEQRYCSLKASLYEDFKEGVISKDDYFEIRRQYDARLADVLIAKEQSKREMEAFIGQNNDRNSAYHWVDDFLEYRNIQELSRQMVVECIEQITIFEGKRIEVKFTHAQDYSILAEQLEDMANHQKAVIEEEAV